MSSEDGRGGRGVLDPSTVGHGPGSGVHTHRFVGTEAIQLYDLVGETEVRSQMRGHFSK